MNSVPQAAVASPVRPAGRAARTVTVLEKTSLTPNMTRVVLGGEALADFPEGFEGGYVKLMLQAADDNKPVVRSYTVSEFDAETLRLVLDMVSHGDTGPAVNWVNEVRPGDNVTINGPGACQPVNIDADWFILAGDMSALPAINVNLARLPKGAKGHLVVEVISFEDRQVLDVPEGITVHWVINPEPATQNSVLEDTVMALPWQAGRVSVWVAGEFSASRALRQYFRHERALPREDMYVSCYWKIGETDEGMKAAKRVDAEPW